MFNAAILDRHGGEFSVTNGTRDGGEGEVKLKKLPGRECDKSTGPGVRRHPNE